MYFRVAGQLKVDDRRKFLYIEPAGGHIGGHQYRSALVGETDQHQVALTLLQIAMDRQRRQATLGQGLGQLLALLFRVAKDQRRFRAIVPQDPGHRLCPLILIDLVENLLDNAVLMRLINTDLDRFALDSRAHGGNRLRIGGGEEQSLLFFRCRGDQRGNFFLESHIEHPVRFIENQRLQEGQVETATPQMIEKAAGGTDHHMGAMLQRAHLRAKRDAAAERQDPHVVRAAGQAAQLLAYLIRQLAGRT